MKKIVVISLGGSLVVPEFGEINIDFLKKFKKLILKLIKKDFKFIIIVGGGKTSRLYQKSVSKVTKISAKDKDWLGIYSTYLNAHLIRTIFQKVAYPMILDHPKKPVKKNWKLLIGSGYRPGRSTDYLSVLLAKRFKTKEVVNIGDVPFVYDKDPQKYKNAKPFKEISWENYRKIIGSKWSPGLSVPFDPVAARLAEKLKISVFIVQGTEIKNFENLLSGKKFQGTTIQ